MRFRPEFRRSLRDIFHELSNPFNKGKINRKSAVTADLVTLGDSWLNFAIGKGLIEPMKGAEDQDWFQDLSDKWKVRMHLAFVSLLFKIEQCSSHLHMLHHNNSMVPRMNKRELLTLSG